MTKTGGKSLELVDIVPMEYIQLVLSHFSISELVYILHYSGNGIFKRMRLVLLKCGGNIWEYKPFRPNFIFQLEKDNTSMWQQYVTFMDLTCIIVQDDACDLEKILGIFLELPVTFPNIKYLVWECDNDTFHLLCDIFSFVIYSMKNLVCLDAPRIFSHISIKNSNDSIKLTHFVNLLHLDLSYCDVIDHFDAISLPNLISLRVKGCREELISKIKDDRMGLQQLQYLDISDSIFLNIETIHDILTSRSNIKSLIVFDCPFLTRSCIKQLEVDFSEVNIVHNSMLEDHSDDSIRQYILDRFIKQ